MYFSYNVHNSFTSFLNVYFMNSMISLIYEDWDYTPHFMQGPFQEDYDYPRVLLFSWWFLCLGFPSWTTSMTMRNFLGDLLPPYLWSWHHQNCFLTLRSSWLLIHIQGTFDFYIWMNYLHARDIAISQADFITLSIPRSASANTYIEHYPNYGGDIERLMF